MTLDLHSLKNSIVALEKSISTYYKFQESDLVSLDDIKTIESGVIQHFEVSYEQCWKFMKRWIEQNVGEGIVDGVPRVELFRISAQQNLIDDSDTWMIFHRARNLTSHTYNMRDAETVFEIALTFLEKAKKFLNLLENKNV